MKVKINFSKLPILQYRLPLLKNNKNFAIAFSLLSISLLISIVLLLGTFGVPKVNITLPSFNNTHGPKEISDYTSLSNILESQPVYSKNSSTQYYLVEINDFDCESCARFHGFGNNNQSSFDKLKNDFILKGKVKYTWLDKKKDDQQIENKSLYCVTEINPKKLLEYLDIIYKDYQNTQTIDTVTISANKIGINSIKLKNCINSNKYNNRITKLNDVATTFNITENQPNLYLIRVSQNKIKNIDGTFSTKKYHEVIKNVNGNADYENIKAILNNGLKI